MRVTDQAAYLLHRRPYGERSVLAELWTREQGRQAAIARQVRGNGERSASLVPFNPLRVDLSGRGEVVTLTRWEEGAALGLLSGGAALAGMYVNELLVRLLVRGDACPALFDDYTSLLRGLRRATRIDWSLRQFESGLLRALGFGLDFSSSADGRAIEPEQRYQVDLQRGIQLNWATGGIGGVALLALAGAEPPSPAICNEQRLMMRALFSSLLGARGLSSWEWSGALPRSERQSARPTQAGPMDRAESP